MCVRGGGGGGGVIRQILICGVFSLYNLLSKITIPCHFKRLTYRCHILNLDILFHSLCIFRQIDCRPHDYDSVHNGFHNVYHIPP